MIPRQAFGDLLAAERALVRFDASLTEAAHARRHACDAARRTALALLKLDGILVTEEDLLLAQASPEEVDLPQRADAGTAAALHRLLIDLEDGVRPYTAVAVAVPKDGRLRRETVTAWSALAAETRRLLAEAEAVINEDDAPEDHAAAMPETLTPWSLPWVEEIHARWYEARHGRRPAPWSGTALELARQALRIVDEALSTAPGLAGAARALHRLHTVREMPASPALSAVEEDEPSLAIRHFMAGRPLAAWWPQFARIAAPRLLARACGLDRACLPLGAHWARDYTGYRSALGGSEEDWVAWTARLAANAAEAEMARAARIEARHAQWCAATMVVPRPPKRRSDTLGPTRRQRTGSRRSTGRLPRLLDLLWEQPMVSARIVERRLGMSYRSALDLIQDLEKAGVLRLATPRKLDRLWRAVPSC